LENDLFSIEIPKEKPGSIFLFWVGAQKISNVKANGVFTTIYYAKPMKLFL